MLFFFNLLSGRANVDMLEETRLQMQMMQENFVRIEAGLNAEIEQLTSQLESNSEKWVHCDCPFFNLFVSMSWQLQEILQDIILWISLHRLSQAEFNAKAAEAAHNDLVAKNAELLAELNTLKEEPKSTSGLEEAQSKIDELSQAVAEANKLTVKLKAEHKAKVKALNKQIESLRKVEYQTSVILA